MKYAIIFDMDGVLVDSEPVIEKAAILTLKEYGIDAKPEDFHPFVGTGEGKYIGGVAAKYGLKYKPEMKQRLYQVYLEIVEGTLKTVNGTLNCLHQLFHNGFTLVLASSADRIKINANLRVAGIDQKIFKVILGGEDVVHKKPAPDIYLTAAKKIEYPASNCVVIEDAVNGIRAARAAGMACIAVSTTFPEEKLRPEEPDFLCADLEEVCEIFSKHYSG